MSTQPAPSTMTMAQTLADLYQPIHDDLKIVKKTFDDELMGDLPFITELCETVRSYRGKMLRPSLLLLVAKASGGIRPVHHTLAAVVEMVHMATLVHDDVLDDANERRKQPTINTISGNEAAVLLGDYLISHAFHLCSSLHSQEASRIIGAATNTVCEGELLQNYHRGNMELSETDYLEIIRRKTAALTAATCELGAMYTDTEPRIITAMKKYGLSTGIAFQIIDDVLDIVGNSDQLGKTLRLDAKLGKLTLPFIHAISQGSNGHNQNLRDILSGKNTITDEYLEIRLKETGSIDYAVTIANQYVADAIHQLEMLPISESRASLTALAEFIVQRRF